MSVIQRKPFIQNVLDTLGDKKADLLDLVNGSDKTPEFRSLINQSALITGSDKNKVQYVNLETWAKTYSGYLIYNNSYCVLIAFTSNTQALVMLDINATKSTYKIVKEYLDINELRRYLEEADDHIVPGEIDSGEAQENAFLVADGDGGTEFVEAETGDATYMLGFDAQGNIVKDNIPEGITVSNELSPTTEDVAVSGPAVAGYAYSKDETDALLEDKANVDGNYPTMTVGVADNLSPYDEDSGDDQDEPFILQGTGTANGTQNDFSTGAIALMREKQGNTVCVNQRRQNSSGSGNNTTQYGLVGLEELTNLTYGHTILVAFYVKGASDNEDSRCWFKLGNASHNEYLCGVNDISSSWQFVSKVAVFNKLGNTDNYKDRSYFQKSVSDGTKLSLEWKNLIIIDLTQWFNGDIPQDLSDNPSNFFRYYQGSLAYNTGELVNANGRYIKCIGMNQWDEEWELGGIDGATGNNSSGSTTIRSKNYIKVTPNAEYQYVAPYYCNIRYYDANKNYLGYTVWAKNTHNIIPSNACYIRFVLPTDYGTTYNHDISINLYYEDESRCLTYEPYQVLTNNDTGNEVLRSAGSVKDIKAPDGTIHRRIGVYTFTGNESWDWVDAWGAFRCYAITNAKGNSVNAIMVDYLIQPSYASSYNRQNMTFVLNSNSHTANTFALINNNYGQNDLTAFKSYIAGKTIFYELATPTTEQGTPYSENLVIDDFGSMDFQGTSGVPQGNLIFYPVDYKAFIDTLYNYTDGTPSELALKSDLPTAPQTFLESISGYDATKTQTLKNVEGALTWVDDE